MRADWSLRTRFLLAACVLVVVLCGAFAVAVHEFIELLEDEMLNRTLVREMQEFKRDVADRPEAVPPSAGGLSGYIVRRDSDRAALPREIASLSPGVHEDVVIQERVYYVAVDAADSARLYLLLDTERVDVLEGDVVGVAVLMGLIAIGLAAALGFGMSRAVMRPVTQLANDVAHLDPSRRKDRLENRYANREVGVIAAAFDDYMDRLERVLEREQAFTEDASHELRTPLAIISSSAELLAEEPDLSAASLERVQRIRRAANQMQSLIEALLFLARGEPAGRPQQCALDQIVREAAELVSAGAAAKSLDLRVEVQPVAVTGAPVMVACVVNNLLLNAVNFTQSGSIDINLTPGELTVRDTGIGIPPQDLSRIFERRYRGAQSRGLGLGLYLVSRICNRLGWAIETESAEGEGTTFRVRLSAPVIAAAALVSGLACFGVARGASKDPGYRLLKEIPIAGDTGWDYLSIDSDARRLYVTHGTHIVVVDLETDAVVGDIADTPGVHGFAIAHKLDRGFASDGQEAKVSIVDLKTLATSSKVSTEEGPDGILFEPRHEEVYAFNGRAHSATVLSAASGEVVATIKLPGKPEFAAADAAADRVYNNIEDKSEVVVLDARTHRIVNEWPIAPGESASGMAFDVAHHRLFLGCENRLMLMMDSATGKVVDSVPIGSGVDANAFDDSLQLAFSSNGEGTVTIAHEDSPSKLTVVQTLKTQPSARTMTLDPKTHRIYLAAATFGPAPEQAQGAPRRRPPIVPGTFKVLVYGPAAP
jgi:signal transduction histidine kinase